jgi:hypothetical protein
MFEEHSISSLIFLPLDTPPILPLERDQFTRTRSSNFEQTLTKTLSNLYRDLTRGFTIQRQILSEILLLHIITRGFSVLVTRIETGSLLLQVRD